MVTHQLQVERRTGKVRRPETDVLPLSHATKSAVQSKKNVTTSYRLKQIMYFPDRGCVRPYATCMATTLSWVQQTGDTCDVLKQTSYPGLYLSNFIRGGVEVLPTEVDDRANA